MTRPILSKIFFFKNKQIISNVEKTIFYINKKNYSTNPKVVQISSPEFKSILTKELLTLDNIFKKYNYEIKIAGGAVRDLLSGIRPHDIDLATNATPQQMLDIFQKENIRVLNTNGLKHGTVPVRINDKENYEITTLRIDVKTDGRHAIVEFTNDWYIDANRRDLTINSMFLDINGNVIDYFNGIEDLKNKKVRFVGEPDKRIKEDYLRILRYFRFFGRVADDSSSLYDSETFYAIKNNSNGLAKISAERKWYELKKILSQNYADRVVKAFYDTNIAVHLGMPKEPNFGEFNRVYSYLSKLNPKPMTVASALFINLDDLYLFDKHLKLSNDDKLLSKIILTNRNKLKLCETGDDKLRYYKQALAYSQRNYSKPFYKDEFIELLKYQGNDKYIDLLNDFVIPKWMLNELSLEIIKNKLSNINVQERRLLTSIINEKLRYVWIQSDFKLSKEDLLKYLDNNDFIKGCKLELDMRSKNKNKIN